MSTSKAAEEPWQPREVNPDDIHSVFATKFNVAWGRVDDKKVIDDVRTLDSDAQTRVITGLRDAFLAVNETNEFVKGLRDAPIETIGYTDPETGEEHEVIATSCSNLESFETMGEALRLIREFGHSDTPPVQCPKPAGQ